MTLTARDGMTINMYTQGSAHLLNASPLAPANYVSVGDSIQFSSDGAGSNTTPTTFTALIRMA